MLYKSLIYSYVEFVIEHIEINDIQNQYNDRLEIKWSVP
jgi:hypothetical protein